MDDAEGLSANIFFLAVCCEFIWPPGNPDLNRLDFLIWPQMKEMVYKEKNNSRGVYDRK